MGIAQFTLHIVTVISLVFYFYFYDLSAPVICTFIILFVLSGFGITAGYHRFYAHKAYKLNNFVEAFLLLFGTLTWERPVLYWAYEHRLHHQYVDREGDPYSIQKGFWYAHMLWVLFYKRVKPDPKIVPDLYANKLVMFQYKHYNKLLILTNGAIALFFGWYFHDFVTSFLILTFLRIVLGHHFIWTINSVAHTWGTRIYSKEFSAANNYWLSLITFGECYHNFHHTFPSDYRNGPKWYHLDITKWFVWALNKLGLAWDLNQADDIVIEKTLINTDKKTLIKKIGETEGIDKALSKNKVIELHDSILGLLEEYYQLKHKYTEVRKTPSKDLVRQLTERMSSLRKHIRRNLKGWYQLHAEIVNAPDRFPEYI